MGRIVTLSLVVLAACVACGGRTVDPGDAGGGTTAGDDDGGASDAPPGAPGPDVSDFPICPANPPPVGSPCFEPAQGCLYPGPSGCVALVCGTDGHWQSASGC